MLESLKNWGLKEKNLALAIIIICFVFYPYLFFPSLTTDSLLTRVQCLFEEYFAFCLSFLLCLSVLIFIYGLFFQDLFKKIKSKIFVKTRVSLILMTAIAEFFLLYYFRNDLSEYAKLFGNGNTAWLGPVSTMLIAAPIAFFIWAFRNEDKKKDQQHKEEDIRQSDFHKIEEWATNFPIPKEKKLRNRKTSVSTEGALQIAAIYQLLPYLKSDYGERFVRPSMEIYHSILSTLKLPDKIDGDIEIVKAEKFVEARPRYINAIYRIIREESVFFRAFHEEFDNGNNILLGDNWIPLKHVQLNGIDLNSLDLHGINLYGASLKFAHLNGCNLQYAKLQSTDFSYTRLHRTNFEQAKFFCTKFDNAELQHANFKDNSTLNNTNFNSANLQCVDFSNAFLNGACFGPEIQIKKVSSPDKTSFDVSYHTSTKFRNATLCHSIFTGAQLKESTFIKADLKGAIFRGANLQYATFEDFNLGDLIFSENDFHQWLNDGAKFIRCYVYEDFTRVNLNILRSAGIEIRPKTIADGLD